ncbi:hypothetical protein Pfo_025208 [Paulownia fortunei]|nr:hypothetical protein Pfo_025208 [Paulownia fortunei]
MELPTDLVLEIFRRLPCKDVLSSKCVCRAWYKLLSDPDFTTTYARNSPFTTLILTHGYMDKSVFLLEFAADGELIRTPIFKPEVPDFVETDLDSKLSIIGSCNGLLFLLLRRCYCDRLAEKVYVCNPLLGGCVALAEDKVVKQPWDCVEYKLGYVPFTNNFKLLRFVYQDNKIVEQAKIFTVGMDDKWRSVEDPFTCWVSWCKGHENLDLICTFDFGEEKSSGIPKPPGLLQLSWEMMNLTILNNRLSLVDLSDYSQMSIWTMEEYAVAESWSRNILLRCWIPYYMATRLSHLFPIAVLPNGNILFSDKASDRLFSFSLEKKQCTLIKVSDADRILLTTYANTYAPRFYSLKEDESGGQYWNTQNVWSSILSVLVSGVLLVLCVKRFLDFVYELLQ